MKTTKLKKTDRIAKLTRERDEALAGQVHTYHFASYALNKLSTYHLATSGLILSITVLGGREPFDPVMIRDGLSKETIAALKADLVRSYNLAIAFKPEGV